MSLPSDRDRVVAVDEVQVLPSANFTLAGLWPDVAATIPTILRVPPLVLHRAG